MQKWSSLPTEILIHVISLVGKNDNVPEIIDDLSQCALTCRNWRVIAQPVLFSKITFKDFETDIDNLCQLMMNNDRLGTYVKELKGDTDMSEVTSLITMDSLFPNIERIKLCCDIDSDYPFFCKLITEEGKFRNLRSMPFTDDCERHSDMYIECALTLKYQTTKVSLPDHDYEEKSNIYLNLCNKLYHFPKLQSVCIGEFYDDPTRNVMDYVESITAQKDNLMHLEKIEIELYDPYCLLLPSKELHTIHPSINIKDVGINVGGSYRNFDTPNEQCLQYIMKKFPNPSRIRLLMRETYKSFYHTVTNDPSYQDFNTTLSFLQYLFKIPDCRVSNIFFVENTAGLIKELFSSIMLNIKVKLPRTFISGDEYMAVVKAVIGVKNNVVDGTRTISIVFNKYLATEFEQQNLNLFREAGCFLPT